MTTMVIVALSFLLLVLVAIVDGDGQARHAPLGTKSSLPPRKLKEMLTRPVKINNKTMHVFQDQYFKEVQKRVRGWKQCVGKDDGRSVDDEEFTIDDILVTVDQADKMVKKCKRGGRGNRHKRQIIFENSFWPITIPILFTDHAKGTTAPGFIQKMIEDFNKYTCVRWQVVNAEPNTPYVLIITDVNAGCYTYAGMNPGINDETIPLKYRSANAHPVFLAPGCLWYEIVVHEMLHVVGLLHEQSRPDRDGSLIIHWDNVQRTWHDQFRTCENDPWDPCELAVTAYDLNSVMHYGRGAATIDSSKPGMSAVNPALNTALGTAHDLSHSDWHRIATAYCQPASGCGGALNCGNGYPDPNQCRCVCADGFGPSCDPPDPQPSFHCGGLHQTTDNWHEIVLQTTRYAPNSDQCIWVIEAPENRVVELETRDLSVYAGSSAVQPCEYSQLEIRTQSDALHEEAHGYCGQIGSLSFYSTGRRMMVIYRYSYSTARSPISVFVKTTGSAATAAPATTSTTSTTTTPAPATCRSGKWLCANNWQCINRKQRCNNKRNCWDGSDEQNCP